MKRTLKGSKAQPLNMDEAARVAANLDQGTLGNIQDVVNRYGGKSDGELLNELRNARSSGAFNAEELENVARRITPMLSPEQQQKLLSVMQQLK